ncbi:MAG: Crp/Fnr family transcriptional regulator [Pseudomonadota bacterium]
MSKRKDIHNSDIPVVCRACEARHRGVCGALTPEQLLKLSQHTKLSSVKPDTTLLEAETPIDAYSNVVRGVVKLSKLMPDGRQQIVGLQFAPDFLGRPFQRDSGVSAEAADQVALCSFPRRILEQLTEESPELEHKLHEQALRELDEARDLMLMLGRKTAGEKVASFLLLLIDHMDPEGNDDTDTVSFELPLKRADIADFLGLTIETISRQLTKLRKAKLVEIENNRTITVPSIERLRNVSGDF